MYFSELCKIVSFSRWQNWWILKVTKQYKDVRLEKVCIFCYMWLISVSLWFLGRYNASDWFRGSSAIVSGCAKWNQGFGRCLFLLVLEFPNCSSPPYYEEFYFCSCLPSEVVLDLVKLGWNNVFLLNWWASYKSLFAMCHSCHQWVALQRVLTLVPCCW